MKKTSVRKLMLKRQTMRQLDTRSLDAVAGGWYTDACPRSQAICGVTDRCSDSGCPFDCASQIPYCDTRTPCR